VSGPPSIAAPPEVAAERQLRAFLAGVAAVLIVGSHLIWSSPEYRQQHLFIAALLALLAFKPVLWPVLRQAGWRGRALGGGLLLAHRA